MILLVIHKYTNLRKIIVERFPSDGVFCVFVVFRNNAQIMHKCTNSCSRLIKSSASLIEITRDGKRRFVNLCIFCVFTNKITNHSLKTDHRNPHNAIWRDLYFTTGQTVFFFRASARKTKNKNSSHGTRAIRWASAALALSSACGPSTPVPIDGAR